MSFCKDDLYEKIVAVDKKYQKDIQSDQFLLSKYEEDKKIIQGLMNLVAERKQDIEKLIDYLFNNFRWHYRYYETS